MSNPPLLIEVQYEVQQGVVAPSTEPLQYKAFLSYSSKDEPLAKWLLRELESWRTPKQLVGQPSRHGTLVPERLGKICRDRDEFPTASFVDTVIREKLRQSEQLIVLCSENSADRRSYVDREIAWFRLDRAGAPVHALLNGVPPKCFPSSLRENAPLAGSLLSARLGGDGKARALVKLVAGILGVEFDALWQRERKRLAFRRLANGVVGAAVLAVTSVLGYVAATSTMEALARQREVAASNMARAAIAESRDLHSLTHWSAEGLTLPIAPDFQAPLATALKSAAGYENIADSAPPIVFAALRETLLRSPPWGATLRHNSMPLWVEWKRDGTRLMTASMDGTIQLWDGASLALLGKINWPAPDNGRFGDFRWHFGWCGDNIIAGNRIIASKQGVPSSPIVMEEEGTISSCDGASERMLAVYDSGRCEVRGAGRSIPERKVAISACSSRFLPAISAWSADGTHLVLATPDLIQIADPQSGRTIARVAGQFLGWSQTGSHLAFMDKNSIHVVDARGKPSKFNGNELRFWIEPARLHLRGSGDSRQSLVSISPDLQHTLHFNGECSVGKAGGICEDIALRIVPTVRPGESGDGASSGDIAPDGIGTVRQGKAEERAATRSPLRTVSAKGSRKDGLVRHLNAGVPYSRVMFGHLREPSMVAWSPDGTKLVSIAGLAEIDRFMSVLRPEEDHSAIVWGVTDPVRNPGGWHVPASIPIVKATTPVDAHKIRPSAEPLKAKDPAGSMPLIHLPSAARWAPEEDSLWVGFDTDDCNACRHNAEPVPVQEFQISTRTWRGPFWLPSRTVFFDATAGAVGPLGRLEWPFKDRDSWQYSDDDRPKNAWIVQVLLNDGNSRTLNHPGLVSTARWSPDGRRVLTACQDGLARVWDGMSGSLLAEFEFSERTELGARYPVDMADWSPSGRLILLFSESGRIQIESANLVDMIEAAKVRLATAPPRGLTRESLDAREVSR